MTLRSDITAAYDEIAPPATALQSQIRMLVAAEAKTMVEPRRRRGPWMTGLRGTMALVAALLVVLIVATVLVGGRVWHDWGVFTTRPAPAGQTYAQQLAALEARPLQIPLVPPDATCPEGPFASADAAASFPEPMRGWALGGSKFWGAGPAYAIVYPGGGGGMSGWGQYADVLWIVEPQVTGLVLIRGRDAANHELALVYVGHYAAGAVIGTDTLGGPPFVQRAELVFDASHHPATSIKSTWGIYEVRAGIPGAMSGCHAFQVDGDGFSEVFLTHPG
jgi:hypothetical protein